MAVNSNPEARRFKRAMRRGAASGLKITLFLLVLALADCQSHTPGPGELKLTNFAHLNHLYENIAVDDKEMAIIHIYSEYPDYGWVATEKEGIACVDDAARAAVVYLRHFEITGDTTSLRRARALLDFCR
ncbi:MAG: hypothetical protein ACE5G1_03725, partial [bacterium]